MKGRLMRSILTTILSTLIIVNLGSCTHSNFASNANPKINPSDTNKISPVISNQELFTILKQSIDRVKNDYVEPINNYKVLEGALNGVMNSLDPHSYYLNQKQYQELRDETGGQFGGLGIEVTVQDGEIKIMNVVDDTPAVKAGLEVNDLIIGIDDESTVNFNVLQAVEKMRGKPGTSVKLTIRRGDMTLNKMVTRDLIKVKSVKSRIEKNTGYIRLSTFNETTAVEVIKAIHDIQKKQPHDLRGYILDLRNNSGGLLDQAVDVSTIFIDKPNLPIVSIKQPNKRPIAEFKSKGFDYTRGKPIIVLINGATASASEIVAGALQDYKRAVIIGTKSFGKGSVQQIVPIKSGGALRYTIAFYYTPRNRSIQKLGIIPDIVVEQHLELKTINANKSLREALLSDSLNELSKSDDKPDAQIKSVQQEKNFKPLPDFQLEQAFHILEALNLDRAHHPINHAQSSSSLIK